MEFAKLKAIRALFGWDLVIIRYKIDVLLAPLLSWSTILSVLQVRILFNFLNFNIFLKFII